MERNYAEFLISRVRMFTSLSFEQAKRIAKSSKHMQFSSGEELSSAVDGALALMLSGNAEVYSPDSEKSALLRILGVGDVFGVAGLFSGSENVSRIISKGKSEILIIPREEIISLISENRDFARDYVTFLEHRIAFLNKRISSFTAGSCERKLALYLCYLSEEETFSFGASFSSLAKQLNMGRASFYRALGILEGEGLVSGNGKVLTVLSRKALKAKYV